jgi:hypothetical protein
MSLDPSTLGAGVPVLIDGVGGVRPRKTPSKSLVVEPAPSHDGSPCITAYDVDVINNTRPLYALRVYDTRPTAGDQSYIRELAEKLHVGTMDERCSRMPADNRDRIEVVGLPLSADVSDEERTQICEEHHMAEIAARKAAGTADFYLPKNPDDLRTYERSLVIIDRLETGWENAALNRSKLIWTSTADGSERRRKFPPSERHSDPHGGFLYIRWDLTEKGREFLAGDDMSGGDMLRSDDVPVQDTHILPLPIYTLAGQLAQMRSGMQQFRCFVLNGDMRKDLLSTFGNTGTTPCRD